MIIVWGSIETKPEFTENALELSLEHVKRSRLEPGCLMHSVQIDVENKQRIVFFEEWEDMNALQIHFQVPESVEFIKAVSGMATGAPLLKIFDATQVK